MAATSTPYGSPAASPRVAWPFRPSGFLILMALLQLLHMALRPLLSATVGTDDVDQLLFSQVLAVGYSYEQMPLYTWLMWGATQLLGPTVLAVALVKYGLVFLIHAFTYFAAREALRDPRLQVAAGLSPMAFYPIGWRLHEADSYSVLATVLMMAVAWLALRLLRERRLIVYLGLGVALGLGLLSSGFFGIGAAAFLLALAAAAEGRRALFHWGMLLALPIAAAIVWPYAEWVLDQGAPFWERFWQQLAQGRSAADLDPWYLRGYKAVEALVLAGLPFWIIAAVVFFNSLRPLPRDAVARSPLGSVLWAYLPLLVAATVAAAIALDMHQLGNFRVYPSTLPLALLFFWRVEQIGPRPASLRWTWLVFALLTVVVIQARFQHIEAGPAFCKQCRMQAPYPSVAEIVREAGYDGRGTIVAGDNYVAGNFHVQFPEARVVSSRYPEFAPPPGPGTGPCLVIWHEGMGWSNRTRFEDYLATNEITLPPEDQIPLTVVEVPHTPRIIMPNRTIEMRFVLFPGPVGTCR